MSNATPGRIIVVGAILPILATASIALRLRVRWTRGGYGHDDTLIMIAWLITTALGIMMIVGGATGNLAQKFPAPTDMSPEADRQLNAYVVAAKMRFASNLLSTIAFGCMKVSVLIFYRRIFRGKPFQIISYTMIGIIVAWTIAFVIATFLTCGTNLWAFWAKYNSHNLLIQYCASNDTIEHALTISDVLTDTMVLMLPVPMIWQLKMQLKQKVALTGVFLTGGVAIAASITRTVNFYHQTENSETKVQGNELVSSLIYWSEVELGISVVAACLPTVRPLLIGNKYFDSFMDRLAKMFSMSWVSSHSSARNRTMTGTASSRRLPPPVTTHSSYKATGEYEEYRVSHYGMPSTPRSPSAPPKGYTRFDADRGRAPSSFPQHPNAMYFPHRPSQSSAASTPLTPASGYEYDAYDKEFEPKFAMYDVRRVGTGEVRVVEARDRSSSSEHVDREVRERSRESRWQHSRKNQDPYGP